MLESGMLSALGVGLKSQERLISGYGSGGGGEDRTQELRTPNSRLRARRTHKGITLSLKGFSLSWWTT